MTETRIKTTLRVDSALWKAIRVRAVAEGRSAEALITDALTNYIKGSKRVVNKKEAQVIKTFFEAYGGGQSHYRKIAAQLNRTRRRG